MNVRFLTDPAELAAKWPGMEKLLAPVVNEAAMGEFTLDDIRMLCEQGRMYVGLCEEDGVPLMAMAFEFLHYPRRMNINVVALGGTDLDAVAGNFLDIFKGWARQAGASEIEASCSKAMARMLKKYGFASAYERVRLAA